LSKENRRGNSGREGGNDGINASEVAIGKRESMAYKSIVDQRLTLKYFQQGPNCSDTHNSHRASTVHLDEDNPFGIGEGESDVEEEDDWHDEETACQPTRPSEAMLIEVRLT
jgi:hypothetical protein